MRYGKLLRFYETPTRWVSGEPDNFHVVAFKNLQLLREANDVAEDFDFYIIKVRRSDLDSSDFQLRVVDYDTEESDRISRFDDIDDFVDFVKSIR